MPGSSRIDGEYPRRPEARMATAMAPRDAPSCLARRGGRGGRGGARGLYGGARGRRGARRWRAAAAAVLRVRGRESRGRGGGRGRVRAVRGSCVATFRTSRRRGGGQPGRCRGGTAVSTRRPHASGLLAGGGGRLALASRLGRPAGPHRGGEAQVSPSFLLFLFSNFSDICFDLINILNHLILLCQFL